MITLDRISSEREFHDRQAAARAVSFERGDADLRFHDDDYLDHEPWLRPAFDKLGDVRGKTVLDLGCGHGMAAVVLARRGAVVSAVDLSPGYVRETRLRADANGMNISATASEAECLPFETETFDAVWGSAILHHLDMAAMAAELHRVLKPGGVAVFCEPWGGNPLLRFARRWLPYPGKHRTRDEKPLQRNDIAILKTFFPALRLEGFQLFGMASRVHPRFQFLNGCDRLLPPTILKFFGRYVVLTLPSG